MIRNYYTLAVYVSVFDLFSNGKSLIKLKKYHDYSCHS